MMLRYNYRMYPSPGQGRGSQETPKSVVFAADLPETVGGKVLKYKLRAEHAGHYRNVDP